MKILNGFEISKQKQQKILDLLTNTQFLKLYYISNKNIWITLYTLEYKEHEIWEYPEGSLIRNIFCVLRGRNLTFQEYRKKMTQEEDESMPHFELWQFLSGAIEFYETFGVYMAQLE